MAESAKAAKTANTAIHRKDRREDDTLTILLIMVIVDLGSCFRFCLPSSSAMFWNVRPERPRGFTHTREQKREAFPDTLPFRLASVRFTVVSPFLHSHIARAHSTTTIRTRKTNRPAQFTSGKHDVIREIRTHSVGCPVQVSITRTNKTDFLSQDVFATI